jgi:hypothetical protein
MFPGEIHCARTAPYVRVLRFGAWMTGGAPSWN